MTPEERDYLIIKLTHAHNCARISREIMQSARHCFTEESIENITCVEQDIQAALVWERESAKKDPEREHFAEFLNSLVIPPAERKGKTADE